MSSSSRRQSSSVLARNRMPALRRTLLAVFAALVATPLSADEASVGKSSSTASADAPPFTMVVMDPLALPLSCPCVKGYAQRKYEALAQLVERRLNRPVKLVFSESLVAALKGKAEGRAELIIGKRSVVEFDARRSQREVVPVASLTGKDGATTQTGLVVVPAADPAQSVADLKGYRVIFGPEECDEKYAAALALLKEHGIEAPAELETAAACDEGAMKILEAGAAERGAAVISSYAKPLLEGCGAVPKGALRVVGETRPVPFVTAFVSRQLPDADRDQLLDALLAAGKSPELCKALETSRGFIPLEAAGKKAGADASERTKANPEPSARTSRSWNGWRGAKRDAVAAWLPERLPARPAVRWRKPLSGQALAGVAADEEFVIVADRDAADRFDIFRCLRAQDGSEVWSLSQPAEGELDYGNSARATPLIEGDAAYLLNAFGRLFCVELATGELHWAKDLRREFGVVDERPWGVASSPLIVDDRLIVAPGGAAASLAALSPRSGKVLWTSPGAPAAYSSLVVGELGGRRQLVGYDRDSLGGWDIATGERLWRLEPPQPNDFNVPTPLIVGGRLLAATENNGTRLYDFDRTGRIAPRPAAEYAALAPDCHSPVAIDGRLFGVSGGLHCLDLAAGLKRIWLNEDDAFSGYATIIAAPGRILATTQQGELLLFDTRGGAAPLDRQTIFEGDSGVYSYPALVGAWLFVRGSAEICCIDLAG